jgi:hypothetical protein
MREDGVREDEQERQVKESSSQLASALPLSGLVNILLALETVFPMSARERRLDFLV